MVRRILLASAVVALGLALPTSLRAQDMGGSDDAKKDDAAKPVAPAPDAPKPDAPKPDVKPSDAPKPADAKKTLVFDAAPSSWKTAQMGKGKAGGGGGGGAGQAIRARYYIGTSARDADAVHIELLVPAKGGDFDSELGRWVKAWQTADGKNLDKSAVKTDTLETVGGIKAKTAEIAGTFTAGGGRRPKKGDDSGTPPADNKKPGYKSLVAFLPGPDGNYIARITGPEKAVDGAHDDFMKWVKSAKASEGAPAAAAPAAPSGGDKGGAGKDD